MKYLNRILRAATAAAARDAYGHYQLLPSSIPATRGDALSMGTGAVSDVRDVRICSVRREEILPRCDRAGKRADAAGTLGAKNSERHEHATLLNLRVLRGCRPEVPLLQPPGRLWHSGL